jgi:hypothetical protein
VTNAGKGILFTLPKESNSDACDNNMGEPKHLLSASRQTQKYYDPIYISP